MVGNNKDKKLKIIRGTFVGVRVEFDEPNGNILNVDFNPTEYSVDKSSNYNEATIPGLDSPLIQFTHGSARSLSLELLLDSYTYAAKEADKGKPPYAEDGRPQDIRDIYLSKIDDLLAVDSDLHAPPPCKVVWGSLEFVGVLQDAKKRFVYFLDDGRPVRARVNLTFKEYIPIEVQLKKRPRNSPDRRKSRLISDGDALWRIAYDAYGDTASWRALATFNDIDDPLRIETGTRLTIPPVEELPEEVA